MTARLAALRAGLSVALPSPDDTNLLRACLWNGPPAREAWDRFRQNAGDLRELFRADRGSRKRLGPLLSAALRRNAIAADPALLTVLRTAQLREELRATLYTEILGEVLQALHTANVPVLVLRGAALAATLYAKPDERHSHDIDLLVRSADVGRGAAALEAAGFRRDPGAPESGDGVTLLHRRALPINLLTGVVDSFDALWSSSRQVTLSGRPARILSAADQLFDVLVRAAQFPAPGRLQWATDAWLLIERSPDVAWERLSDRVSRSGLVLPCWSRLEYLADALHAGVPAAVRAALAEPASAVPARERDAQLYQARTGAGLGGLAQLRSGTSLRDRAYLLAWLLFPSAAYVRQSYGVRGGLALPPVYLKRMLRYGVAALRSGGA